MSALKDTAKRIPAHPQLAGFFWMCALFSSIFVPKTRNWQMENLGMSVKDGFNLHAWSMDKADQLLLAPENSLQLGSTYACTDGDRWNTPGGLIFACYGDIDRNNGTHEIRSFTSLCFLDFVFQAIRDNQEEFLSMMNSPVLEGAVPAVAGTNQPVSTGGSSGLAGRASGQAGSASYIRVSGEERDAINRVRGIAKPKMLHRRSMLLTIHGGGENLWWRKLWELG